MLSLIRCFRVQGKGWCSFLTISALFFMAFDLWARAGGGGGFSGGGFSGGGGRGNGSGGDIFFLIYLIFRYPVVGIPVTVIFLVILYFSYYQGKEIHVSRTISKYNQRQGFERMQGQMSLITGRDPQFSPMEFKKHGTEVFFRLQDAWANQDMRSVRTLVSDGIFERFTLQLEMMRKSRIINKMDGVCIADVDIALVEAGQYFNAITLKIEAGAADYYVDTKSGKVVYGDHDNVCPFTEFWTFIRRPGAKTVAGKSLLDNNCPNCGASLEISDCAECPSCKSVVNSGDYDWVLTEITQESEWQTTESRDIPGLPELQNMDPTFNVNHIEDRVSVMFYRWIASQFFADSKYIRKLAAPGYLSGNNSMFKIQDNGKHLFYADAAVGSVETVEVICGNDYDKVRVKVKWSGHREAQHVPDLIVPDYDSSRIFTQEYILTRKHGVQSSAKNVLNSVHCPNCGAAESLSDKPYCEYCHTPLNDGSHDWVLETIQPFSGYPSNRSSYADEVFVAQMVTDREAEMNRMLMFRQCDIDSLLAAAAYMMLSDGEIAPEEYSLLKNYASQRNYSEERLKKLISSVQENTIEVKLPENYIDQEFFLRCLIQMCLADGKVTLQEKKLLNEIGAAMNLTSYDVQLKIGEERSCMYRKAKGRN